MTIREPIDIHYREYGIHKKKRLYLNDVLNVPKGQSVVSIQILNPTFNQQDISDKYAILDIKARAVGYGYVNVEIQLKIRLS